MFPLAFDFYQLLNFKSMSEQSRIVGKTVLTNGAGSERAHRISARKFVSITPANGVEHPVAHGILISGSASAIVRIKCVDDDAPNTMEIAAGVIHPMDVVSLEADDTESGLTVFFVY